MIKKNPLRSNGSREWEERLAHLLGSPSLKASGAALPWRASRGTFCQPRTCSGLQEELATASVPSRGTFCQPGPQAELATAKPTTSTSTQSFCSAATRGKSWCGANHPASWQPTTSTSTQSLCSSATRTKLTGAFCRGQFGEIGPVHFVEGRFRFSLDLRFAPWFVGPVHFVEGRRFAWDRCQAIHLARGAFQHRAVHLVEGRRFA